MWTTARIALGLSSDEFWALSPREYAFLIEAHNQRERMLNYRAGLAPAVYASTKEKKIHPLAFFGQEPKAKDDTVMDDEQMDAAFRDIGAAIRGYEMAMGNSQYAPENS